MISAPSIVTSNSNLREIVNELENARIKLCVLVDADGRLIRTIVDGDIRRALLSGMSMKDRASKLPIQKAIFLTQNPSDDEVFSTFELHPNINSIVVVNDEHKPIGVIARNDISKSIFLSPPHIGKQEKKFVERAFEHNWIAPVGPNLTEFEQILKQTSGRSHTLALSTGTAALHLALRVLGIGYSDRVYVSDLTFVASLQAILYQNAEPVLIDSEPQSWNMSPEALKRKLQKDALNNKLPKAIIVVHLFGQSANLNQILEIANEFDIAVIEDAAESLGAKYNGKPSGSHGLLSVYSFNGNKIITTSGGGALVSDREDLIEKARLLATQGRDNAEHYQHSEIAYNYRMSNVLAGIGIGQLKLLESRVMRRVEIFNKYQELFKGHPGISFQGEAEGSEGNRWLTVISMDPDIITRHPYQLMNELRQDGIESRPCWKPMHMQPLCANYEFEPFSETEVISSKLFLQCLCLPSGSNLTLKEQQRIASKVFNFIEG